jgi:hypothetical protein
MKHDTDTFVGCDKAMSLHKLEQVLVHIHENILINVLILIHILVLVIVCTWANLTAILQQHVGPIAAAPCPKSQE